jgi:hypothetical protein
VTYRGKPRGISSCRASFGYVSCSVSDHTMPFKVSGTTLARTGGLYTGKACEFKDRKSTIPGSNRHFITNYPVNETLIPERVKEG